MTPGSLSTRLLAAASAGIVLAIVAAGLGLTKIFDGAIERRAASELRNDLRFLAGELRLEPEAAPVLDRNPPDPRFEQPYGGRYWQIEVAGHDPIRSRSLWDTSLVVPPPAGSNQGVLATVRGPNDQTLAVLVQSILVPDGQRDQPIRVAVGLDRAELESDRTSFLQLLVPSLAVLAIFLALSMWLFQRFALRPLGRLRTALGQVHEGDAKRVGGRFPAEVQPLVDDLNRLLDHREMTLERARARAGELAHGLKTPLAVLDVVARDLSKTGAAMASEEIRDQVDVMNRHVRHTLARARAAVADPFSNRRTRVRPIARRIVNALSRLPDAERLSWDINIDEAFALPFEEGDLTEILGNLLDNARKWARHRIIVDGQEVDDSLIFEVDDDGPGMPDAEHARIDGETRPDATRAGTGLGLPIVRDLVEPLGGRLELTRAEIGGLRARIIVPPSWSTKALPARLSRLSRTIPA
jgi:signal transduction histidine kinase